MLLGTYRSSNASSWGRKLRRWRTPRIDLPLFFANFDHQERDMIGSFVQGNGPEIPD
jgi:hypothetical protein